MKHGLYPFLIAAALLFFPAQGADRAAQEAKQRELTVLKNYLATARDSLQADMTARWRDKQRFVEQREDDKQELDRLRESLEKAYSELSRMQEEILARSKALEDETNDANLRKEEWSLLSATLGDALKKEADLVIETFPLDREDRRMRLEALRNQWQSGNDAAKGLSGYLDYFEKNMRLGTAVGMQKQVVLPDEGDLRRLDIARFGNVFAYGMADSGSYYLINQTGRIGADRYAIQKVAVPDLKNYLARTMPEWVRQGAPQPPVRMDIMQNEQSRHLVAGKKSSYWTETVESLKAGGAVMIPLLLLPFWALSLILYKGFQIYGRRKLFSRQFKTFSALTSAGRFDEALGFAKTGKGMMARVFQEALERRGRDRHAAERAVRELIFHEIPVINRNLNTLAVIAGAAPLIGLLGTISGMITLFAAVTHYGTGDPKFLAGGISEALITAKTGLAVAIPALFAHDILRTAKDKLLAEIEWLASGTMEKIWPEG
jgi:biopolymer transport protein ExbB